MGPAVREMLAVAEGTDAEALVEALLLAATVDDVPALRRIGSRDAKQVVTMVQSRAGADRGGLALAEQAGGELAVVPGSAALDAGPPSPDD